MFELPSEGTGWKCRLIFCIIVQNLFLFFFIEMILLNLLYMLLLLLL